MEKDDVLILAIRHRKTVYDDLLRRIDQDNQCLEHLTKRKGKAVTDVVNQLVKRDMELLECLL